MYRVAKWLAVIGVAVLCCQVQVRAEGYQPLPESICEMLQSDAADALGIEFSLAFDVDFEDYVTSESGTGCLIEGYGTGEEFGDPRDIVMSLKSAFVGWEEDEQYQASGGFGEGTGLRRDEGLLLISASWSVSEEAECDPEEDSDCEIADEDRVYEVVVKGAMQ